MVCDCGGQTEVVDSRYVHRSHTGLANTIRRRRRCLTCAAQFTTFEIRSDDAKKASSLSAEVDKMEQVRANLRKLLEP